jgi:hypothetical protein
MSRKDAAAARAGSPVRFDNLDEFFKSRGSHDGSGVYDWLKDYDVITTRGFDFYTLLNMFLPLYGAYVAALDDRDFDDVTREQKTGFIIAHFMDRAIILLKQQEKLPQNVSSFLKLSDCKDPNMEHVLSRMFGWIKEWFEDYNNHPYFSLIQRNAYGLYLDAIKAQQAVGRYTKAAKAKPAVTVAKSSVSTFGRGDAAAAATRSDHSKDDSVKHHKEETSGYEFLPDCS